MAICARRRFTFLQIKYTVH